MFLAFICKGLTLRSLCVSPERGGLTANNSVFRYDFEKVCYVSMIGSPQMDLMLCFRDAG
jgi:hypothetical protein